MKKFLMNIAIFFAIVAVMDFSLGKVFYYLQANVAGGRTGAEYYACKKSNEDVIIMGSSRASHHYVPKIITEKTGLSCFNAGQDGNGIIMQYGRWKMISERYTPKLIIYDISHDFDFAINDNMAYIDRLKPFCAEEVVRKYVASLFPIERVKTFSNLYCYNYKFIEMLSDCIRKPDYMKRCGYLPLYGHIRREVVEEKQHKKKAKIIADGVKLFYLEQLVKDAKEKEIDVVFVVSPFWNGGGYTTATYEKIQDIAKMYNVPFVDYSNSELCEIPDFFEDSHHLNDKGAKVFTKSIISQINYEVR